MPQGATHNFLEMFLICSNPYVNLFDPATAVAAMVGSTLAESPSP
jgi:hypothetical protein